MSVIDGLGGLAKVRTRKVMRSSITGSWALKERTSAPLPSHIEVAGQVIRTDDMTDVAEAILPGLQEMLVGQDFHAVTELEPVEELEAEDAPGAPSAALLLNAARDLTAWLPLTQEQLAGYVGLSSSTVMAWKRVPDVHPRHRRIPSLLRLWAAVSGARDEFGEAETRQMVWGSGSGASGSVPALSAEELAEHLIGAADAAAREAFEDDGYTPETATLMSVEDIEAGERALSHGLSHDLEGSGDSGPA